MEKKLLTLKNFTSLSEEILKDILTLRNSQRVRCNMRSKKEIPLDEHLSYCKSLHARSDILYFAVFVDEKLEGVLDFKSIDPVLKSYESGCYFIENATVNLAYYANLAAFIVAKDRGLERVNCCVMKSNIPALLLNTCKLGYKIVSENSEYSFFEKDISNDRLTNEFLKQKIDKVFILRLDI